jgi:hypothetical protein
LAAWLAVICVASLLVSGPLSAAAPTGPIHYFQSTDLPPGAIAYGQLLRGGPLPGYFQPIEIQVPQGAKITFPANSHFDSPRAGPALVGMLIGPVYLFKITNIPFNEGAELFPTIEVINRLYPPEGLQLRFPVPIQVTQEELELAIGGQFVTRVVYLEDPAHALPSRDDPRVQRYFDAPPGQDPLQIADRLGRPMAILRLGSRIPDLEEQQGGGLYGSPPLLVYPKATGSTESPRPSGAASVPPSAIDRYPNHVPRVPLETGPQNASRPSGTPQLR